MKTWGKWFLVFGSLFPTLLFASLSFEPIQYDTSRFEETPYVRTLLSNLVKRDQDIRKHPDFQKHLETMRKIDDKSTKILKELLKTHGWIVISKFGDAADNHAWILLQHSEDLAFQKSCLAKLEELYPKKETNKRNYAMLYDRVAMHEERPQRFGSQGITKKGSTEIELYKLEGSVEEVEVRRKEFGFEPIKLTDYLSGLKKIYK